jgi:predicted AAA+ superfamily ATPase
MHAYPIHPRCSTGCMRIGLRSITSSVRGVLKLMAKVIHRIWKDNDKDPLIMPGSFPLQDADTRNEVIYYLPQGWDPVVERDVDGERAETTEIENRIPGSARAGMPPLGTGDLPGQCARAHPTRWCAASSLSASSLGVAQPGQQVGIYKDALRRLGDRLHYLNSGNNRFWFDTRPNLRREMEERKRRFQDKEDVFPAIRDRVQRSFASGVFGGIHVFTASSDVPDDWQLRLVVLPPDAAFSRSGGVGRASPSTAPRPS